MSTPIEQTKSLRNKTIRLTETERLTLAGRLLTVTRPVTVEEIIDKTICGDAFVVLDMLPARFADLIVADPPYNLTKSFNGKTFSALSLDEYAVWLDSWVSRLGRLLKPNGSIYISSDWRSSAPLQSVLQRHFVVRNRITWEREKGRGAYSGWKNCSEDIWFCTIGDNYTFNSDSVKIRRRVIAPYRNEMGGPKDWAELPEGRFRLTFPSNLWTDITVPFWSMPENTDHPTQKPEKLLAKLILASSNRGEVVFDPFLGSGTSSVVAKKLNRHYIGVEIDEEYCCLAEKRLLMAETDTSIQGYVDGHFWDRNTHSEQLPQRRKARTKQFSQITLLDE